MASIVNPGGWADTIALPPFDLLLADDLARECSPGSESGQLIGVLTTWLGFSTNCGREDVHAAIAHAVRQLLAVGRGGTALARTPGERDVWLRVIAGQLDLLVNDALDPANSQPPDWPRRPGRSSWRHQVQQALMRTINHNLAVAVPPAGPFALPAGQALVTTAAELNPFVRKVVEGLLEIAGPRATSPFCVTLGSPHRQLVVLPPDRRTGWTGGVGIRLGDTTVDVLLPEPACRAVAVVVLALFALDLRTLGEQLRQWLRRVLVAGLAGLVLWEADPAVVVPRLIGEIAPGLPAYAGDGGLTGSLIAALDHTTIGDGTPQAGHLRVGTPVFVLPPDDDDDLPCGRGFVAEAAGARSSQAIVRMVGWDDEVPDQPVDPAWLTELHQLAFA